VDTTLARRIVRKGSRSSRLRKKKRRRRRRSA